LDLGRDISGECALPAEQRELPSSAAFRAQVAEAPVAAFNPVALRERAKQVVDDAAPVGELVRPARWWSRALAASVAMAAAAFLVVRQLPPEPVNRVKGEVSLDYLVLRDGVAVPGQALGSVAAGDAVQFVYSTPGESLAIIGVDGGGVVKRYYPEEGELPLAIAAGQRMVLEGSLLLDDAPGPEVFVASFGETDVGDLVALVREAFEAGGVASLLALDDARPDLVVRVLEKE
jgi:hypothetical protein